MSESQRLRHSFLQQSAQMLFLSTPAISRQLMCESHELGGALSIATPNNEKNVCSSCGTFLLPQWTMERTFRTKKVESRGKNHPRKSRRSKVLSQRCSTCYRVTKNTASLVLNVRSRREKSLEITHEPHGELPPPVPTTDRASKSCSKKRAKTRKDREGLQALLKKTEQTNITPNLNLMDLMKK